jgi:hypothetical protein
LLGSAGRLVLRWQAGVLSPFFTIFALNTKILNEFNLS